MISPSFIREYVEEKFSRNFRISSNGIEYITESPYLYNDFKRHFSINLDTGLWQDFKSQKSGNFVQLYAFLEGITYREAERRVILKSFLKDGKLPETAHVIRCDNVIKDFSQDPELATLTPIYADTVKTSTDQQEIDAWCYAYSRRLFDLLNYAPQFFITKEGKYRNRLIIPFMNDGKMFYFQGRSIREGVHPKYLNCEVHKKFILYPYSTGADTLIVTEGPLDALSLKLQGINATCLMGCKVSVDQFKRLQTFNGKLILGLNFDKAGLEGLARFEKLRKDYGAPNFSIVKPPFNFKDWNKAHVEGVNLQDWISKNTKLYDFEFQIKEKINEL